MTWAYMLSNIVGFLGTYVVHSTLILVPIWWLVVKCRWPLDPGLRGQLLKLSLLAPLATALTLTCWGELHFGPQFPLVSQGLHAAASDDAFFNLGKPPVSLRDAELSAGAAPATGAWSGSRDPSDRRGFALATDDPALLATGDTQLTQASGISGRQTILLSAVVCLWSAIATVGLIRLVFEWISLQGIRRDAPPIMDAEFLKQKERLRTQLGIRRPVALLQSSQTKVPMAAGIVHPFILIPQKSAAGDDRCAMLAHELGHIASRDAWWNLVMQIVCRVFFFQPLNGLTCKAIRQEMDFEADLMAVSILGERMSLARCLYSAGTQLNRDSVAPVFVLASGMAIFRSTLGQRIEAILSMDPTVGRPRRLTRVSLLLVTLLCAFCIAVLAPRAVGETIPSSTPAVPDRNNMMKRTMASLLVVAGLSMPTMADEPTTPVAGEQARPAVLKTTPDELPDGIRRFNGMLVGRVAAKDVERGTFTVVVDAVPRVWENSRAENPRSIVGKTTEVTGVFGKFLDVLIVTRVGDTIEFECKHDGDGLVFPGELLRKVAPFDPADYPVLPEEFRGFRGQVLAEIVKKDPETFELILRVERVLKTWEDSSAKDPRSIEGKPLMLAGFWNRRDAYHGYKVGDRIEVGMRHIGLRSDHLNVSEAVSKATAQGGDAMASEERRMAARESKDQKNPLQGFRGMLVGRLLEKDAEQGTFTVTVDAVPRVWENNQAANPKALIGRQVAAEGVSGRLIDALVVTKVGDTIEFGALHDEGTRIRVGELLRKVAPVQPGDYPVLPDGFRGFRGMVTAKVVRKGEELSELIVEVEKVEQVFDGSRAKQPESIIGKQVMLAGFWNRKDEFHSLHVGDRIRCGMNHPQLLSDHLVVMETVRKLDNKAQ
ncbi:MAG: M56 family metallopeptidase [Planctomycetaceae bacterium]